MEKFLTVEEVAKILDKPLATVRTETSRSPQNLPPFFKSGGQTRFPPELIRPWAMSKIINPLPVVDAVLPTKKIGRPVKGA